jgi:hypothetical protein
VNTLDIEVKEAILRLSDADLARLVEVDFREHTEEAVAFARAEIARRAIEKTDKATATATPEAKPAEPVASVIPEPQAAVTEAPKPDANEAAPEQSKEEPEASVASISQADDQAAAEPAPSDLPDGGRRRRGVLSRILRLGRRRPSD